MAETHQLLTIVRINCSFCHQLNIVKNFICQKLRFDTKIEHTISNLIQKFSVKYFLLEQKKTKDISLDFARVVFKVMVFF